MKGQHEFDQEEYDVFAKYKSSETSAHKKYINRIEWNPNGTKLASSSQTTLRLWNFDESGSLTRLTDLKYGGHESLIDSIRWRDPNTLLSVSKQSFKIWDIRDNKIIRSQKNDKKFKPDYLLGEWKPEEDVFAILAKDSNAINFYDLRTAGIVESLKPQGEVGKFCWDNEGSVFLISIWESSTGSIELRESVPGYPIIERISCHPAKLTTFQISETNQYLITGSEDATINVYDLEEMLCIQSFHRTEGTIQSMSLSPDCQHLLVSNQEDYFDIYNIETGRHCYRKQNDNGLSYSQVRWNPVRNAFAMIEEEDKSKKSEEGKIRIFLGDPKRYEQ